MKNTRIANLLAVGVGIVSLTASAEVAAHHVFDVKPRAINLQTCDADQLSLSNIHQMISQRNCRDIQIVRSSADNTLHL